MFGESVSSVVEDVEKREIRIFFVGGNSLVRPRAEYKTFSK